MTPTFCHYTTSACFARSVLCFTRCQLAILHLHIQGHRWDGSPGLGPNAEKDLIQREFWGLGSIPA